MTESIFDALKCRADAGDDALDALIQILSQEQRFEELLEAMLMKVRRNLGLSLLDRRALQDYPPEVREQVKAGFVRCARTVGGQLLEKKRIAQAWPYYRSIDEVEPVSRALESFDLGALPEDFDDEQWEGLLNVALNEGVNPTRGYQLVLARGGTCDGITVLESRSSLGPEVRETCSRMLLDHFLRELEFGLSRSFARREEPFPENAGIRELLDGRPWLFEERSCHVDDSHLQAVLRIAARLPEPEDSRKALELAEYGCRLPEELQISEDAPFQNFYEDYRMLYAALVGEAVAEGIVHFTAKAQDTPPDDAGAHFSAEILVFLLSRVGRHKEALDVYLSYFKNSTGSLRAAPSLYDLSVAAGDFGALLELARNRKDPFEFAAALAGLGDTTGNGASGSNP